MPNSETQRGEGAKAGDQQQATKAKAGSPRPEYDQYEVNQADSINSQAQSSAQAAYGNSGDEEGGHEQEQAQELPDPAADDNFEGQASDNPPGGEGKPLPGEISVSPARRAKADAERPLGKD